MTLFDLINNYTKVTNLDDGTELFETGLTKRWDDFFLTNLEDILGRSKFDDLFEEIDDNDNIEEIISDKDYILCKQIIHAAWLTYNSISLFTAMERQNEEQLYEEHSVSLEPTHKYEVCIGDDFKTEIMIHIDFWYLRVLDIDIDFD